MAADLEDLRAKITTESRIVLEAYAECKGIDVSSLVRQIIQEWADEQIAFAMKVCDSATHEPLWRLGMRVLGSLEEHDAAVEAGATRIKRASLSSAARVGVYVRDKGACTYCRCVIDREGVWHIDHIVPVSKGGTNDPANLCLACAPCNLKKAARDVSEFKVA